MFDFLLLSNPMPHYIQFSRSRVDNTIVRIPECLLEC